MAPPDPYRVAYFVHDVWDAAVAKRVRMLTAGGASVQVTGFRRRDEIATSVERAPVVDLGRTNDAALKQRAATVLRRAASARLWGARIHRPDVIIARSLELLLVAWAYRRAFNVKAPLVYECLDIHRIMLAEGALGRAMRALERFLLKRTAMIITSSPAYEKRYFRERQNAQIPVLLLENKSEASQMATGRARARRDGPPWRIGWFGMLRCAKSLRLLCELARALPSEVEILIAGRVSRTEFADFEGEFASLENVTYTGPYTREQLADLYGRVDFAWAMDFFEEGLNSAWLLPNRLYESAAFGVVPLALESVETGRWLAERDMGVRLPDEPAQTLQVMFQALTPEHYDELAAKVAGQPMDLFAMTKRDCDDLVMTLKQLPAMAHAK